jgi:hypothetical protein
MLPRLALTFVFATVVLSPATSFFDGAPAFAQSLDKLGTALSNVDGQSSQPEPEIPAPAYVSHVEGAASIEREGRAENSPLNMPLLSGDRLKVADGRVEVLFADGAALHLDTRTTVDFQSDDLARLIEGRLRLNIPGPARSVAYRIDSPAGSVRISQPGEYRIALVRPSTAPRAGGQEETQLELAVLRGSGEVFTDLGATPVRAGERAYASAGLAPSYAYTYNSANWDAFDRWSETRRDVRLGVSAQYLPSEMRTYASTFDDSGDWRYEQSYGHVWYPRVAADWRPYYHGRWAAYPRYGWTWIGADRFAWPTHHYGRWGFSAGAWFWIPGNRWAPAYVSWGYAPGYVSWCPLGFDNRPVIAINIFNGGGRHWRGWTSVSRGHFGRGFVHHRAVNWDRVDRGRRPDFRVVRSAPVGSDYAVPRPSTRAQGAPSNVEGRNSVPIQRVGSRVLPPEGGSHTISRGGRVGSQDGSAPSRAGSASGGPASSRAGSWLPPSGGRESAVPRGTNPPRYVNRGDEIVRSQTERPTAPTVRPDIDRRRAGGDTSPEFARPRTAPEGPARRVDVPSPSPMSPSAAPPSAPSGRYRQPASSAPDLRGYRTRTGGPEAAPRPPAVAPEAAPRPPAATPDAPGRIERREPVREPGPQNYARPRGYDARPPSPPPSRVESPERSAPAPSRERAAPPPAPAPAARPRDTAVPRARGGRGGA